MESNAFFFTLHLSSPTRVHTLWNPPFPWTIISCVYFALPSSICVLPGLLYSRDYWMSRLVLLISAGGYSHRGDIVSWYKMVRDINQPPEAFPPLRISGQACLQTPLPDKVSQVCARPIWSRRATALRLARPWNIFSEARCSALRKPKAVPSIDKPFIRYTVYAEGIQFPIAEHSTAVTPDSLGC